MPSTAGFAVHIASHAASLVFLVALEAYVEPVASGVQVWPDSLCVEFTLLLCTEVCAFEFNEVSHGPCMQVG